MERLGEYLKKGREDAGVSLEDLAARTRIRLQSLQALEKEDLDALPSDLYVRGFVKLVCREIGLVPEEGLLRYETLKQRIVPDDAITWEEERSVVEPGALERALRDPDRVVRQARLVARWGGVVLGGLGVVFLVVLGIRALDLRENEPAVDVASADPPRERVEEGAAAPEGTEPGSPPLETPDTAPSPPDDEVATGKQDDSPPAGDPLEETAPEETAPSGSAPEGSVLDQTVPDEPRPRIPAPLELTLPATETLGRRLEPSGPGPAQPADPGTVAVAPETASGPPDSRAAGTPGAEPVEGSGELEGAEASPPSEAPEEIEVVEASPPSEAAEEIETADTSPPSVDRPRIAIDPTPALSPPEPLPEHREFIGGPVAEGERVTLMVEALRPVEIIVFLDGAGHPREKTLSAGEKKRWKAGSYFLLNATDAGAIRLWLQGQNLGVPGPDRVPLKRAVVRPRNR